MQAGRSPLGKAGFHFPPDFSWQPRLKLKFGPHPLAGAARRLEPSFLENSPHP
jgi:hypothetical protein